MWIVEKNEYTYIYEYILLPSFKIKKMSIIINANNSGLYINIGYLYIQIGNHFFLNLIYVYFWNVFFFGKVVLGHRKSIFDRIGINAI